MHIVNTHQAKTHLSKLLTQVSQGKEFIIGKAGVPVAKLVPIEKTNSERVGGQLNGKIHMSSDFDVLPDDFMAHFVARDADPKK